MSPNFHQFPQKWPFSDKKINKKYFLKPKLCPKTLKSIFFQRTLVSHIFYAKSNVYKSITISFKRIYECILRFVSLILIWKVWRNLPGKDWLYAHSYGACWFDFLKYIRSSKLSRCICKANSFAFTGPNPVRKHSSTTKLPSKHSITQPDGTLFFSHIYLLER